MKELFRKIERMKELEEDFKRTENAIKDIKKSIWQKEGSYFIKGVSEFNHSKYYLCELTVIKEDYQKIMEVMLISREEHLKNLTKEIKELLKVKKSLKRKLK